jgi:aspartyl-tRNA(Asn)/glutamyl-tRNA(Gln) amidotransferase subunit A
VSVSLRALVDEPWRRREVPASELVELVLARIEATAGELNAYITVTADQARADAAATDARRSRGESLGPLDGFPIAVKDNIDVAGVPATRGSRFFAERIPEEDAEVVRRLRAAGAIVLGKVALHEFAYGATTDNPHFGACRNPWDTDRVPGGSSGGSGAALGADLCLGALGTDTGGSVRIPAALNGVSALRPTYGLVSARGTFPVSAALDTIGPMARTIADVAEMLAVMAGYDRDDPHAVEHPFDEPRGALDAGVASLRVGLPRRYFFEDVDPAIAANTQAAADVLAGLGAEVVDVDLHGADEATGIATILIRAEATGLHRERLADDPGSFGADVLRRLELGNAVTGPDVGRALAGMRDWRVRMLQGFDDVDLLLTPTTNATAPLRADADMIAVTAELTRFTYAWSLAHLPAASIPSGLDGAGLPTGVQLAAAPWHDALVLRAAHAVQEATDWHRRRPPAFP